MNGDKLAQFAEQKYLNLESFRKNGQGVRTPLWFVEDDGVLYFDAPHKVLEFVKTPFELVRDRANIGERGYGSSSRPAKALLIRITPDLKTSFVLPARVRSGALY